MQCPALPKRDPRYDIEVFRQSLSSSKQLNHVGVVLAIPDMVATASGK